MGLFLIFKDSSESREWAFYACTPLNVCMCLFVGAVAAFVTTPLDVAKTRIMLAKVYTLKRTHTERSTSSDSDL